MDSADDVKQRLRERHVRHLAALLMANEDLSDRAMMLGVTTVYDREDDVLRALIGPPTEAATESVDNTILLRYEPETLKLVGIEVVGLSRLLREEPSEQPAGVWRLRDLALTLDAHRRATEQVSQAIARDLWGIWRPRDGVTSLS